MVKDITEAWYPWEGDVKSSYQLFAFAAVDDDCRVNVEPAIVVELDNSECNDKESREKGHWEYYRLLAAASGIRSVTVILLTEGARARFHLHFVDCACKAIKAPEGPKEAGSH
jgi:hypothetical protein